MVGNELTVSLSRWVGQSVGLSFRASFLFRAHLDALSEQFTLGVCVRSFVYNRFCMNSAARGETANCKSIGADGIIATACRSVCHCHVWYSV